MLKNGGVFLKGVANRVTEALDNVTAARGALLALVIGLLIWHGLDPDAFAFDATSIFLIALATLLVLVPVLKSATLPGGTGFEFRQQIEAAEELRLRVERNIHSGKPLDGPNLRQPGLFEVPQELRELVLEDPAGALASLRAELWHGLHVTVRGLGGYGAPRDLDAMVDFVAEHTIMWPEQVSLLKLVGELSAQALLSGAVTPSEAQRVIAIADTLNSSFVVGYSPNLEPNPNWEEQDLICEFEHCIENMPLPPIPRSEQEAWRARIRAGLDAGKYDRNPELKQEFEAALTEPIPDDAAEEIDRSGACPIFGHFCPGGAETVEGCLPATEWLEALAASTAE